MSKKKWFWLFMMNDLWVYGYPNTPYTDWFESIWDKWVFNSIQTTNTDQTMIVNAKMKLKTQISDATKTRNTINETVNEIVNNPIKNETEYNNKMRLKTYATIKIKQNQLTIKDLSYH